MVGAAAAAGPPGEGSREDRRHGGVAPAAIPDHPQPGPGRRVHLYMQHRAAERCWAEWPLWQHHGCQRNGRDHSNTCCEHSRECPHLRAEDLSDLVVPRRAVRFLVGRHRVGGQALVAEPAPGTAPKR